MRLLFFGDQEAGVRSLDALARHDAIVGVVTPERAPSSDSVHEFAAGAGRLERFARDLRPDLLWIAGYAEPLPPSLLALAPLGAVKLHASLLPLYRGLDPVHWAILRGERELGLTAHVVDQGVDSGDLLAQGGGALAPHEDYGDARAKLLPLYGELSREVVRALRQGTARRTPQAPG